MKSDPTLWLLARSSGLTAYALATASMVAGLVLKGRPVPSFRPASVTDLHRVLSMLTLGALALHGTALVLDRAVDVGVVDLLVPGTAPYRPLATGLGVLAAWLTVALVASFPLRRRLGVKRWRAFHRSSYAVFALSTAHGVLAGTDTGRPWAAALYALAVGSVLAAAAFRFTAPRPAPARKRQATVGT